MSNYLAKEIDRNREVIKGYIERELAMQAEIDELSNVIDNQRAEINELVNQLDIYARIIQ